MTLWQQLGLWSSSLVNVVDDKLQAAQSIGAKWACGVTVGDGAEYGGVWNSEHFDEQRKRYASFGIQLGSWHNYFGESPAQFAKEVAGFVNAHNAGPVFLDCELAVQGNTLLSSVMLEVRKALPSRSLCITTNSLNDSAVYNGRIEGVPQALWKSAIDLGYRIAPQWYSSPTYGGSSNPWTTPEANMAWLKAHGMEDNLLDANAPGQRAVPLSYVHPVLEVTGLEGSSLQDEIDSLKRAVPYGFSKGFSIYLLEDAQPADFALLAAVRGQLWL